MTTTGGDVTAFRDISYQTGGGVARITINRPEKLNAFTPHTLRELIAAVNRAAADREVGVLVLTGAGERAFSAGGDVSEENEDTFTGDDSFDEINRNLYRAMKAGMKPVIARVDGYSIGGGHHLHYMCDFTIASTRSIFGQNGPRVASPAQGWLVSHLWTVVGMKRAKEIWMLCRRYTAEQALQMGLINAAVPAEELDAEVQRWCDDLLALSPTVLKLIKRSFDDSVQAMRDGHDAVDLLPIVNPDFFASGEQQEGASAFLQKRRPDFTPYR